MFHTIQNINEFKNFVESKEAVLAYFSTAECNVCKVLKLIVEVLFGIEFPKAKLCYIEINQLPDVAAQNSIFNIPTIVVYFEGKEFIRKSRNFGIGELKSEVQRPYSLMFS